MLVDIYPHAADFELDGEVCPKCGRCIVCEDVSLHLVCPFIRWGGCHNVL